MKEIRKLTLFLGDVAMLYASLALTLVIRYPMADLELHLKNHLYPFSAIFILWLAVFYLSELYQYKNYGSASMLVKRLAGAVFLSVSSVIIFYLFGNFFELTPKINLLIFSGIFLALDYSLRILIAKAFTAGATKIMVLGDAPLLKEIEKYLAGNPHAGYQVADTLKNPGENSAETIAREIRDKKISAVIFQPNAKSDFSNLKTIFQLLSAEVDLINAWDFYEMLFEKVLAQGFGRKLVHRKNFHPPAILRRPKKNRGYPTLAGFGNNLFAFRNYFRFRHKNHFGRPGHIQTGENGQEQPNLHPLQIPDNAEWG